MDKSMHHIILTAVSFLGLLKMLTCCRHSLVCHRVTEAKMRDAFNRSDMRTVCELIPHQIKCLEDAVILCKMSHASSRKEIPMMKERHKSYCGKFEANNYTDEAADTSTASSLKSTDGVLLSVAVLHVYLLIAFLLSPWA